MNHSDLLREGYERWRFEQVERYEAERAQREKRFMRERAQREKRFMRNQVRDLFCFYAVAFLLAGLLLWWAS